MVGYIQKNYKNKITLSEIAVSGNVCRSNCCKIFQSLLNKSPITYLMEYRLDKSIKLLKISSYSVTEIALNVVLIVQVTLLKCLDELWDALHLNTEKII